MGQGPWFGGGSGMKGRWFPVFVLLSIAAFAAAWFMLRHSSEGNADQLILLLPDDLRSNDQRVALWLDAASEEGLHLVPVHDSEFLRPIFARNRCAGIILPDTIHKQAGDVFVSAIQSYVRSGGKLMLVYDAGTLSSEGRYARTKSRFSELAGIDYALYDSLEKNTMAWSPVSAPREMFTQLDVPPGKYYPFAPAVGAPDASQQSKSSLTRYRYEKLQYPSFVTHGSYEGKAMLYSAAGVAAGEHKFGNGSVLFVNLPLAYLKANTDGLLLHSFLKYFAEHTLALAYLASVPDGIGGLVLNWHVDSNAAIKPLEEMDSWTMMKQGPYSIHITAGPDAHDIGDRRGFDVDHNLAGQARIQKYIAAGYSIGSHGGWIHDYFAAHVDIDDPGTMKPFLEKNKDSLERAAHRRVTEYSSPSGDQPEWVTRWLEANGFVGYYFTGDSGMGPTEGYRDGVREGNHIWAFPISHLGRAAAFEEMSDSGFQPPEILAWLEQMTQFAVTHHVVRLIYFHPPGILEYHGLIDEWMNQTAQLAGEGRFRWYTMSALADFLNARKQVEWKSSEAGGVMTIAASHPSNLEHMTWRLPVARFARPVITGGVARVLCREDTWVVVAGAGQKLEFNARMIAR